MKGEFHSMKECEVCKELNYDRKKHPSSIVHVTEIKVDGSYYNWGCDINYCPECGKRITGK